MICQTLRPVQQLNKMEKIEIELVKRNCYNSI
jgi:hypothetical protein